MLGLERYLKVSWLLLVSAQSVGSCIFSEKLEEYLRVTPLERCQDLPQFPLWSLLHTSGMGIHPDSHLLPVETWDETVVFVWVHLYVSQILNFQQGFFSSWSVSWNYIGPAVVAWKMLSEVQMWAVAAYKCLKYLVWDIGQTEEWSCPAVVEACVVIQ